MPVRATIERLNDPQHSTYFMIFATRDFKFWWQANPMLLPRDMFEQNQSAHHSVALIEELRAIFDSSLTSINAKMDTAVGEHFDFMKGLSPPPPPPSTVKYVKLEYLVEPLLNFAVTGTLRLHANRGGISTAAATNERALVEKSLTEAIWPRIGALECANASSSAYHASSCEGVTFDELVTAYEVVRAQTSPPMTVHSTACLGFPDFIYAVGCVTTTLPWGGIDNMMNCKEPPCPGVTGPPFESCLAISTFCGGLCNSGAHEPRDRDNPRPEEKRCMADGTIDPNKLQSHDTWVLTVGAAIFAFFYVISITQFLLQHFPGLGVRMGIPPTWSKFKEALEAATEGDVPSSRQVRSRQATAPFERGSAVRASSPATSTQSFSSQQENGLEETSFIAPLP